MSREREDDVCGSQVERRAVPLSSLWAQVTSDFGQLFAQGSATATSLPDVPTAAASTPAETIAPSGEIMTSDAIPISTMTVEETSLRTSFVTVRFTTNSSWTFAATSSSRALSSSCPSQISAGLPVPQISSTSSTARKTPAPTLITTGQPSGSVPASATANPQQGLSSATAAPRETVGHASQKHAIIGGLSGSIAGLVLIGLILCLCWRRRKPRFDDDTESMNEKGLRPRLSRKWSELTSSARTPQIPPPIVSRVSTPGPEPDGQILRVSLDNWARPYAHDAGYRESQGPTTLRVMNPDLSRPTTPMRPSLETAGSFLKRQRNALAAALYGPRPSSRAELTQGNLQVPASNIDPALSTEFLAPKAIAPSVRSTSTNNSLPVVVQHPPEDPFLTPPDETAERTEYTTKAAPPSRPGLTPLQSVAEAATRTLSHLGSTMKPLRTRSNASASSRSASRRSTSTFSSAGDPFMLDRPSLRPNFDGTKQGTGRGPGGNGVLLYEGT